MRVLWFSLMQIHCPWKENGPASEIISLISMRYLKWNAQLLIGFSTFRKR